MNHALAPTNQREDQEGAIFRRWYEMALKISPKSYHLRLSGISLLPDPQTILSMVNDLARIHPRDYRLFRTVGVAYLPLKDLKRAEEGFKKALELYISYKDKTGLSDPKFEELVETVLPWLAVEIEKEER